MLFQKRGSPSKGVTTRSMGMRSVTHAPNWMVKLNTYNMHVQYKNSKQRSSLLQLGVWPLQGICHAPHSHSSIIIVYTTRSIMDVSTYYSLNSILGDGLNFYTSRQKAWTVHSNHTQGH